jgi:spore coat-associated protein N
VKKILGLTIAALMVIGLVGGGTWAYFSDVETSTGNVFAAGTLVIGLDNDPGQTPTGNTTATFSSSAAWAPGATANGTLYVYNSGTIDITTLSANFDYDAVDDSGVPAKFAALVGDGDNNTFDKMITATTATWNGDSVAAIAGKTLAELKAAGDIALTGGLDAEDEGALYILFTFNTAATNGCQGNSLDLTVTVTGTQN